MQRLKQNKFVKIDGIFHEQRSNQLTTELGTKDLQN